MDKAQERNDINVDCSCENKNILKQFITSCLSKNDQINFNENLEEIFSNLSLQKNNMKYFIKKFKSIFSKKSKIVRKELKKYKKIKNTELAILETLKIEKFENSPKNMKYVFKNAANTFMTFYKFIEEFDCGFKNMINCLSTNKKFVCYNQQIILSLKNIKEQLFDRFLEKNRNFIENNIFVLKIHYSYQLYTDFIYFSFSAYNESNDLFNYSFYTDNNKELKEIFVARHTIKPFSLLNTNEIQVNFLIEKFGDKFNQFSEYIVDAEINSVVLSLKCGNYFHIIELMGKNNYIRSSNDFLVQKKLLMDIDSLDAIEKSQLMQKYFEFRKYILCKHFLKIKVFRILYKDISGNELLDCMGHWKKYELFFKNYVSAGFEDNFKEVFAKYLDIYKEGILKFSHMDNNEFEKICKSINYENLNLEDSKDFLSIFLHPFIQFYTFITEISNFRDSEFYEEKIKNTMSLILKDQKFLDELALWIDNLNRNNLNLDIFLRKFYIKNKDIFKSHIINIKSKILKGYTNSLNKNYVEKDILLYGDLVQLTQEEKKNVKISEIRFKKLIVEKILNLYPNLFLKGDNKNELVKIIKESAKIFNCSLPENYDSFNNFKEIVFIFQKLAIEKIKVSVPTISFNYKNFAEDYVVEDFKELKNYMILHIFEFIAKCIYLIKDRDVFLDKLRSNLAKRILCKKYIYKQDVAFLSCLPDSFRYKMQRMIEEWNYKSDNKIYFTTLPLKEIKKVNEIVENAKNEKDKLKSFFNPENFEIISKKVFWRNKLDNYLIKKKLGNLENIENSNKEVEFFKDEKINESSFISFEDSDFATDELFSDVNDNSKRLKVEPDRLKVVYNLLFGDLENYQTNELELSNSKYNFLRKQFLSRTIANNVFLMKMCRWPKFISAELNLPELNKIKSTLSNNLKLDGVNLNYNDLMGNVTILLLDKNIETTIFQYAMLKFIIEKGGKVSKSLINKKIKEICNFEESNNEQINILNLFKGQYNYLFEINVLKLDLEYVLLNSEVDLNSFVPPIAYLLEDVDTLIESDDSLSVNMRVVNEAKIMRYIKVKKETTKKQLENEFSDIKDLKEILNSLKKKEFIEVEKANISYIP